MLRCSIDRLPAVCNLAAHADSQVLHLAASPGDVVIGLSSPVPLQHRGLAAGDGGAAFLDDLEGAAADHRPVRPGVASGLPSGVILEIR